MSRTSRTSSHTRSPSTSRSRCRSEARVDRRGSQSVTNAGQRAATDGVAARFGSRYCTGRSGWSSQRAQRAAALSQFRLRRRRLDEHAIGERNRGQQLVLAVRGIHLPTRDGIAALRPWTASSRRGRDGRTGASRSSRRPDEVVQTEVRPPSIDPSPSTTPSTNEAMRAAGPTEHHAWCALGGEPCRPCRSNRGAPTGREDPTDDRFGTAVKRQSETDKARRRPIEDRLIGVGNHDLLRAPITLGDVDAEQPRQLLRDRNSSWYRVAVRRAT